MHDIGDHHHHHGHPHDHGHDRLENHEARAGTGSSAGNAFGSSIGSGAGIGNGGGLGSGGGLGHNGHGQSAAQWQTPHLPHDHTHHAPEPDEARDLDLVEKAFCEAFLQASDQTSFLRLAGVPFEAVSRNGQRMMLLRVETHQASDIGSVSPYLGGGGFRYAPLPAKLSSQRQTLGFVYFNGSDTTVLTLKQAKDLANEPGQGLGTGPGSE